MVELLLDNGADVNLADALYVWVMGKNRNMVILDMILRAGVELDGFQMILSRRNDEKVTSYGTIEEWLNFMKYTPGEYCSSIEDWSKFMESSPEENYSRSASRKDDILERIRLERSRRAKIQNVYEFLKVSKPRSRKIDAHDLQNDIVRRITELVLQRE